MKLSQKDIKSQQFDMLNKKIKKIQKICFIEPASTDYHIFSRYGLPRLGSIILGTKLKEAGYDVDIFIEELGGIDLKSIVDNDVVGISTITSTTLRAYQIARELRGIGKTVIMGGSHPTFIPHEALEVSDIVVRGEADDIIVDLINALEKGEGLEEIKGVSFMKNGTYYAHPDTGKCINMDNIPIPDFSLIRGLKKPMDIIPVMTSRGCPYNCKFCSVTEVFGRMYRFRSKELVEEEVRRAIKINPKAHVFFYDDNFAAVKNRTKELLEYLLRKGTVPHSWSAQVRVDIAKDDELLDLMCRTNCWFLYIGFESINPATLRYYNKRQNFDEIEYCIDKLKKKKIKIHGMFVLGSDEDNIDTIWETLRFINKKGIETIQLMMLIPLPGTGLFEEMRNEGRMICYNWSLYDGHHVVFKPKNMTPYELQKYTIKAMEKFYSIYGIIKGLKYGFSVALMRSYGWKYIKKWKMRNRKFFHAVKKFSSKAGEHLQLKTREIKYGFAELLGNLREEKKSTVEAGKV